MLQRKFQFQMWNCVETRGPSGPIALTWEPCLTSWKKKFVKGRYPPWPIFACGGTTVWQIWTKNNNTCRGPWVLHSYQVSSKSLQWFWRRSRKCEKFTTDDDDDDDDDDGWTDGRRTVRYDNSSLELRSGELKNGYHGDILLSAITYRVIYW